MEEISYRGRTWVAYPKADTHDRQLLAGPWHSPAAPERHLCSVSHRPAFMLLVDMLCLAHEFLTGPRSSTARAVAWRTRPVPCGARPIAWPSRPFPSGARPIAWRGRPIPSRARPLRRRGAFDAVRRTVHRMAAHPILRSAT